MLAGRYRDVLADGATRWRSNLIVDGAFVLLAALLKREPETDGILYWAVGAGAESWDREPPSPLNRTTRLAAEVHRSEVPREAIRYVDARGAETSEPSPRLEVRLAFEWPDESMTLREFGLFGGAAGERADSGTMLNHAIHPRIDLEPGQRLTRELRLSFSRTGGLRRPQLSLHWLSEAEPRVLGGVGAQIAAVLPGMGITTLGELARSDPHRPGGRVAPLRLIELKAKAGLVLETAAALRAPEEVQELTVSDVLRTAPAELAASTGAIETEIIRLHEQLAVLELGLDHRFLGRMTVGSLLRGPA